MFIPKRNFNLFYSEKEKSALTALPPKPIFFNFLKESSVYLFSNFIFMTVVYKKKLACLFKLCHCI